jgi:hypothetical protein
MKKARTAVRNVTQLCGVATDRRSQLTAIPFPAVGGAVCMSPKSSQQSERTLRGSKSPYLYCARMPLSQNKAYFMQLTEILPSLALELEQLLKNQGEAELAAQVPQLVLVDRCRCGDDFCSSFYTYPKPQGHYGPGQRCLDLDAAEGMLLVDVVGGKIAQVEILNRLDVRHKLLTALP